ncbi:conserved Plasmodium protein, unknown function [Plasmodium vinckei vinckei]|uniref:Uncharacterized protein n=1 Tax=Plasmodium vinckei vinckei TaxID=54757 RepID=A0A449BTB7_PLAVN|nr:conserved Plasmodium protein, unknown function [Plasmodium vinckei vinckei]VEV56694.1 conserved Plasmodium protein, unknown function [Plasmodium vinckei vinckei]
MSTAISLYALVVNTFTSLLLYIVVLFSILSSIGLSFFGIVQIDYIFNHFYDSFISSLFCSLIPLFVLELFSSIIYICIKKRKKGYIERRLRALKVLINENQNKESKENLLFLQIDLENNQLTTYDKNYKYYLTNYKDKKYICIEKKTDYSTDEDDNNQYSLSLEDDYYQKNKNVTKISSISYNDISEDLSFVHSGIKKYEKKHGSNNKKNKTEKINKEAKVNKKDASNENDQIEERDKYNLTYKFPLEQNTQESSISFQNIPHEQDICENKIILNNVCEQKDISNVDISNNQNLDTSKNVSSLSYIKNEENLRKGSNTNKYNLNSKEITIVDTYKKSVTKTLMPSEHENVSNKNEDKKNDIEKDSNKKDSKAVKNKEEENVIIDKFIKKNDESQEITEGSYIEPAKDIQKSSEEKKNTKNNHKEMNQNKQIEAKKSNKRKVSSNKNLTHKERHRSLSSNFVQNEGGNKIEKIEKTMKHDKDKGSKLELATSVLVKKQEDIMINIDENDNKQKETYDQNKIINITPDYFTSTKKSKKDTKDSISLEQKQKNESLANDTLKDVKMGQSQTILKVNKTPVNVTALPVITTTINNTHQIINHNKNVINDCASIKESSNTADRKKPIVNKTKLVTNMNTLKKNISDINFTEEKKEKINNDDEKNILNVKNLSEKIKNHDKKRNTSIDMKKTTEINKEQKEECKIKEKNTKECENVLKEKNKTLIKNKKIEEFTTLNKNETKLINENDAKILPQPKIVDSTEDSTINNSCETNKNLSFGDSLPCPDNSSNTINSSSPKSIQKESEKVEVDKIEEVEKIEEVKEMEKVKKDEEIEKIKEVKKPEEIEKNEEVKEIEEVEKEKEMKEMGKVEEVKKAEELEKNEEIEKEKEAEQVSDEKIAEPEIKQETENETKEIKEENHNDEMDQKKKNEEIIEDKKVLETEDKNISKEIKEEIKITKLEMKNDEYPSNKSKAPFSKSNNILQDNLLKSSILNEPVVNDKNNKKHLLIQDEEDKKSDKSNNNPSLKKHVSNNYKKKVENETFLINLKNVENSNSVINSNLNSEHVEDFNFENDVNKVSQNTHNFLLYSNGSNKNEAIFSSNLGSHPVSNYLDNNTENYIKPYNDAFGNSNGFNSNSLNIKTCNTLLGASQSNNCTDSSYFVASKNRSNSNNNASVKISSNSKTRINKWLDLNNENKSNEVPNVNSVNPNEPSNSNSLFKQRKSFFENLKKDRSLNNNKNKPENNNELNVFNKKNNKNLLEINNSNLLFNVSKISSNDSSIKKISSNAITKDNKLPSHNTEDKPLTILKTNIYDNYYIKNDKLKNNGKETKDINSKIKHDDNEHIEKDNKVDLKKTDKIPSSDVSKNLTPFFTKFDTPDTTKIQQNKKDSTLNLTNKPDDIDANKMGSNSCIIGSGLTPKKNNENKIESAPKIDEPTFNTFSKTDEIKDAQVSSNNDIENDKTHNQEFNNNHNINIKITDVTELPKKNINLDIINPNPNEKNTNVTTDKKEDDKVSFPFFLGNLNQKKKPTINDSTGSSKNEDTNKVETVEKNNNNKDSTSLIKLNDKTKHQDPKSNEIKEKNGETKKSMNKGFEKTEGETIFPEKESELDSYDNEINNTISNIDQILEPISNIDQILEPISNIDQILEPISNIDQILEPISNSSFFSLMINDSNKINQASKIEDIKDDEKTNSNVEVYTGLIGKILSSNKIEETSNDVLNVSSTNSNNKDESGILVKNEIKEKTDNINEKISKVDENLNEEKESNLNNEIDNSKDSLKNVELKEDKEKSEIVVDNIESENKNNEKPIEDNLENKENPQDMSFEKTETLISEEKISNVSNTKNSKNNKNKKKKKKNKNT